MMPPPVRLVGGNVVGELVGGNVVGGSVVGGLVGGKVVGGTVVGGLVDDAAAGEVPFSCFVFLFSFIFSQRGEF